MKKIKRAFTLAEGRLHSKTGFFQAFTLAEVLITLGIIGIVAALTMPSLIQNYKKKVISTRLKKFVSIMNQIIYDETYNNGDMSTWELPAEYSNVQPQEVFFDKYFAGHFTNIIKREKPDKNLVVYFSDGTSVRVNTGDCTLFSFDINSEKNLPNVLGRDQFGFLFCGSRRRLQYCLDKDRVFCTYPRFNSYEEAKTSCKTGGSACTFVLEWNNWEFPNDYPVKL
ncbi:MAG: type II secretion system GspH family protein [Heliobacteriaceae bacterium]|jgi:prepilin-type N-terminal cleavage/methylation domain-containing protein|nr:type II secretion system GspH family protein [Heliobacteriaceae bacterium]